MSYANVGWSTLIGKSIKCYRGFLYKPEGSRKTVCGLDYILMDDGETIITLSEQDYYTYHDCSSSARNINIQQNKELWDRMFNKEKSGKNCGYDEPDWLEL